MHGGKTPIKHGLCSKYYGLHAKYSPPALQEKIAEAEKDPSLNRIEPWIAVITALYNQVSEHIKDNGGYLGTKQLEGLTALIELATKNIERLDKILHGQKFTVSIEQVQKTVVQIIEIIKYYVPDPTTRKKIADALEHVNTN